MSDNKLVEKVYYERIDFELIIVKLDKEEAEDKLTYFSNAKGKISKAVYDNFLIANCVGNVSKLFNKLARFSKDGEDIDFSDVHKEIVDIVLKYNPKLRYENIVINKNNVLKIRTSRYKLKEGEIRLTDNPKWKETKNERSTKPKDNTSEDLKDINDLQYDVEKRWWKRIGKYVDIKKYKEDDLASLLHNRFFHTRTSFATFVVTVCVVDFESLFQLLDNMGVPARVAPPILMHELYELCVDCNPFLTFDNAQELVAKLNPDQNKVQSDTCSGNCNTKQASAGSSMGKYLNNKTKEKTKTFKDVPKEDLLNLGTNMKVSLIGQDKAVDSLVEAIQRASVGLKDPKKPIGSFLFAGSTGRGKSLTAKVLADELIKDRNNLITIDCSEYSSDHEYSKLIGSPPGYVLAEQGGILTNAVMKNPFSVIVFDEIEKASHKVYQLLLQVLDEGRLTDNKGNVVSFKDTVIIMTSNLGVSEVEKVKKTIGFGDVSKLTKDKKEQAIKKALKSKFKPEFLNRVDEIIYFNDLTEEDYYRIIDIELYKLNDNLQINDTEYKTITLEFDDSIKKLIYKEGIDEEYGARPLKRAIERIIATPLAVELLSGNIAKDSLIRITEENNSTKFIQEEKSAEPPFYMTNAEG